MTLAIVLASASPRRASLLRSAGIPFEIVQPGQVEREVDGPSDPKELAKALACAKAKSVTTGSDRVFLACDTLVAVDDTILGKPNSPNDARRMLRLLSDRWHRVITGVCVLDAGSGRELLDCEETRVRFVRLEPDEIEAYVASGEPLDKAGAYGIQGGASSFIAGLQGPLDNVIGLPVRLVRRMLSELRDRVEDT
ncbi:MAG TPA: Maf family protein [bacterium]|nr:Maf family protein [bacterium]